MSQPGFNAVVLSFHDICEIREGKRMGDPILDVQQKQDPVIVQTVSQPATPPSADSQPKEPGKFGRILGSVFGGAMNVIAPGAGSLIGGLVRGGGISYAADAESLLQQSARQ